ncbi:unnamed protein product [Meganyctiphanes norvegica]|uniref:E3 ubiquitin-protein ligase RNF10 n=1 Tax=Meganyctiphanes norvegica TaxID=48144 RepID=A0AAV2PZL6_MEGNR
MDTATTAMADKKLVSASRAPKQQQQPQQQQSCKGPGPLEQSVKEFPGKKNGSQYGRKKECERPDYGRKPMGGRGGRAGQRYVRPREKAGSQVDVGGPNVESGSLFRSGGKKQNITHLLSDWWGPGPRGNAARGRHHGGHHGSGRIRRYSSHVPKYKKEHYLQANCQFVVLDGDDYSVYSGDPDLLVDWQKVEEVHLHVSEAPACPICLHPPTAAKVTRCGHIYCYACILHYLALSDKKWRSCPICYEDIAKEDLKSAVSIVHKDYNVGEEIEMQLMRRQRETLLPVPAAAYKADTVNEPVRMANVTSVTPYSKLLLASKDEVVSHIVNREKVCLETQLVVEGDQPEACFIQEALSLLEARHQLLKTVPPTTEGTVADVASQMENLSLSSPEESPSTDRSFFSDTSEGDHTNPTSPSDDLAFDLPPVVGSVSPTVDETTVSVEDLDISLLQTENNAGQNTHGVPKSAFYFYQAINGSNIYMHALNVQMLVKEFGALENCPHTIKAKIVEKETTTMTEDLRQRLRYLRHLPVACSFDVIEMDLKQPIISKITVAEFSDQVEARRRKRNKRSREERRIEKRVQVEEDRMMGRSRGAGPHFKIESQKLFPSFIADSAPQAVQEESDGGLAGANAPSERSESPSGDSLYGSSADTAGSGMSFAKMIKGGASHVSHSASDPSDLKRVAWPSLAGGGVVGRPQAWGQMKKSSTLDSIGRPRRETECSEDGSEDGAPPPDYRNAFSDAITRAMSAATIKAQAQNSIDQESNKSGNGKKGKKKKQKQILFSSGGLN